MDKIKIVIRYFSLFFVSLLFSFCKANDPTEAAVNYTNISNAKIAYKVYGDGEPLVMCVGYSANMDLWSTKAIDLLKDKFKVIVFDYRGMGLSTNTLASFTIDNLADDLDEFLIALKINKIHLLGWSMGGYVSQKFAIKHPDKINKLVLYATNCGDTITVNPSQEIVDILSNPNATSLQMLSTLFPDDWLATHAQPWTYLPNAQEPYNNETIGLQYLAVQKWLQPSGGSAGQLSKLTMPVLLLCGDQDKVVPSVNSSILADSITNSSLVKIVDAGHGLMYQLPETFSTTIINFLNQ